MKYVVLAGCVFIGIVVFVSVVNNVVASQLRAEAAVARVMAGGTR